MEKFKLYGFNNLTKALRSMMYAMPKHRGSSGITSTISTSSITQNA